MMASPGPGAASQAADQQLKELETVLLQFYSNSIADPALRGHIEQSLAQLKAGPQSWQAAEYFLSATTSQYVQFFALQICEEWINKRWEQLSADDALSIRTFLLGFLIEKNASLSPYVLKKLQKAIVDIGKMEWPEKYPDFLRAVLEFASRPQTCAIGLEMLVMVMEEFVSTKEDLPLRRKLHLRQQLLVHVPPILQQLAGMLNSLLEQAGVAAAAAVGTPASSVPFSAEAHRLASLILDALQQIFSWVPLSEALDRGLMQVLYRYIALRSPLSLAAFTCVNELLSKNLVMAHHEQFLEEMFQQIFSLLWNLTEQPSGTSDPEYVDKMTQFTLLFVSNHLKRVESSPKFPVLQFLAALFRYTFSQPRMSSFVDCLEIWTCFLEYLSTHASSSSSTVNTNLEKYADGLCSLVDQILHRIQFRTNAEQLQQLSSYLDMGTKRAGQLQQLKAFADGGQAVSSSRGDDSDDEEEFDGDELRSEYDTFLTRSIETVARVAELFPTRTLPKLYEAAHQAGAAIVTILNQSISSQSPSFSLTAARDYDIMLQMLSRLAEFSLVQFEARFDSTNALLQQALNVNELLTQRFKLLLSMRAFHPPTDALAFELSAQVFGTLRAHVSWLAHAQSTNRTAHLPVMFCVEAACRTYDKQYPALVTQSALTLLNSLLATKSLQPAVVNAPAFAAFSNAVVSSVNDTQLLVQLHALGYACVSNAILLASPVDVEAKYQALLAPLIASLVQLTSANPPPPESLFLSTLLKFNAIIHHVLKMLGEGILMNTSAAAKAALQNALRGAFGPIFASTQSQSLKVLKLVCEFFIDVLSHLRIPFATVSQLIEGLMSLTSQLVLPQLREPKQVRFAGAVLVRFLELMRQAADEDSAAFEALVGPLLSVCAEQILIHVAAAGADPSATLDVHRALLQLFFTLLQHPRYVLKQAGDPTRQMPLRYILNAFAQALSPATQLPVYRLAVELLLKLQEKHGLLSRPVLAEYRGQFAANLILTLLRKSHDPARDELIALLYAVASVDFSAFYQAILPQLIQQAGATLSPEEKQQLLTSFGQPQDSPSFALSTNQLINDFYWIHSRRQT